MKIYQRRNEKIATISTFFLIPLSGLVTDVYLPSFPDMQLAFHTHAAGIQVTLTLFLISYGITMFVAGSIIDSYGRYTIVLSALAAFAISNFLIAAVHELWLLYAMRVVQGILAAFIVVAKRAFLVDIYKGDKLKHYMGLLSVVWSLGPILAPFIGGYLQSIWGWTANFLFLAVYALVALSMELLFGGEAIQQKHVFNLSNIFSRYRYVLGTADFSLGLLVLGANYAMVLMFGMTAPFLVEHFFHFSSVITGYCALVSGCGMLVGGLLAKYFTSRASLVRKLRIGDGIACLLAILMFFTGAWFANHIVLLMCFVFALHICSGFMYNVYFTYCLTRFPEHAGVSSGITSGSSYLVTAMLSYSTVSILSVTNQSTLALCYLLMALVIMVLLPLVKRAIGNLKEKAVMLKASEEDLL